MSQSAISALRLGSLWTSSTTLRLPARSSSPPALRLVSFLLEERALLDRHPSLLRLLQHRDLLATAQRRLVPPLAPRLVRPPQPHLVPPQDRQVVPRLHLEARRLLPVVLHLLRREVALLSPRLV